MSHRSSKSGEFIGNFKRFDYAVNFISKKELLENFIKKIHDRKGTVKHFGFDDIMFLINEIKDISTVLEDKSLDKYINEVLFDENKKNIQTFRQQYSGLQKKAVRVFEKHLNIYLRYVKDKEHFNVGSENGSSKISFLDMKKLYDLSKDELKFYHLRIKSEYENLSLKYIKKPSFKHLFKRIEENQENRKYLINMAILLQKDIGDLEKLNIEVGNNKNKNKRIT